MISYYLGKPRGGKTFGAFQELVKNLVKGRFQVTNLVIRISELQFWIQDNHPEYKGNVLDRIRFLTFEESKEYWRYRTMHGRINDDELTDGLINFDKIVDAGEADVDFTMDEFHFLFDSEAGGDRVKYAFNYMSQHAKLNDNVNIITQCIERVKKKMYQGICQNFIYCRNFKHEKFRGFNRGSSIQELQFITLPTNPEAEQPFEKRTYEMDKNLADCYDTSAGIGMRGGLPADKEFKPKGIRLRTALVVIAILGVLSLWAVMKYGIPAIGDAAGLGVKKKAVGVTKDTKQIPHEFKDGTKPQDDQAFPKQKQEPIVIKARIFKDGVWYIVHKGRLFKVVAEGPQGVLTEHGTVFVWEKALDIPQQGTQSK